MILGPKQRKPNRMNSWEYYGSGNEHYLRKPSFSMSAR